MNNNWAEVRQQMEQVLEMERAQRRQQRQARRRQQSSFAQFLKTVWQAVLAALHGPSHSTASNIHNASPQHQ